MTLFGDILALLSLVIVVIVSYLSLKNMRKFQNIIPEFSQYISEDEEGNVLLAEPIVKVIDALGTRIAQHFKMSMLQGMSVNSKLEKGLKTAMAKDIIEEKMPLLDAGAGLLKEFTGYNVKQYIAKNPDALMQLLSMPQVQGLLAQFLGNNGSQRNRSRM